MDKREKEIQTKFRLAEQFGVDIEVIEFIRKRRLVPAQTNKSFFIKHQQEKLQGLIKNIADTENKIEFRKKVVLRTPEAVENNKFKLSESLKTLDFTRKSFNKRRLVLTFVSSLDDKQWDQLIK